MNVNEINSAVLAYIGDAVYEEKVRNYLITKKVADVNELQKEAVNYVSCNNQAKIIDMLLLQQFFTEEELYTINRARNYKPKSKPKHADIRAYKKATSLEALFGMLYLNNDFDRINYIFKKIIGD